MTGTDPAHDARSALLERDELPYANEVDAALSRMPARSARLLSLAVGMFFLCFLVWAGMTDIDEVTHAQGQVVSARRTQTIQNLEGGILQEVLVHEGQVVEKDALLARLSNEMAASTYRDTVNKALEAAASIIRLDAELTDKAPAYSPDFGEDILKNSATSRRKLRNRTSGPYADGLSPIRRRCMIPADGSVKASLPCWKPRCGRDRPKCASLRPAKSRRTRAWLWP